MPSRKTVSYAWGSECSFLQRWRAWWRNSIGTMGAKSKSGHQLENIRSTPMIDKAHCRPKDRKCIWMNNASDQDALNQCLKRLISLQDVCNGHLRCPTTASTALVLPCNHLHVSGRLHEPSSQHMCHCCLNEIETAWLGPRQGAGCHHHLRKGGLCKEV